ncbi:hypothetical protein F4821DRAFT_26531 [Hypoxylon rubiginosum]|uniref:Uncharacterized protein n=1 Tax=Hypoxylon rubiginosum TaxID=110542 RepID=A0ACC0CLS3_9PEZI|nr:hypothetical protein F4821DRAFT_26531 [Hypoxylon rubiginosum]
MAREHCECSRFCVHDKIKLLRVCCKHGVDFINSATSGKSAEKEVWKSITEDLPAALRATHLTTPTETRKKCISICKSRRENPEKSKCDVDVSWIDRWVRIWQCRDLVASITESQGFIREALGKDATAYMAGVVAVIEKHTRSVKRTAREHNRKSRSARRRSNEKPGTTRRPEKKTGTTDRVNKRGRGGRYHSKRKAQ